MSIYIGEAFPVSKSDARFSRVQLVCKYRSSQIGAHISKQYLSGRCVVKTKAHSFVNPQSLTAVVRREVSRSSPGSVEFLVFFCQYWECLFCINAISRTDGMYVGYAVHIPASCE